MKNYEVFFEIYGKRLKTTILAESEEKAREAVRNEIVFHKVVLKPVDIFDKNYDMFTNLMDIIEGKKK